MAFTLFSCSKELEESYAYPEFNGTLNYDSTSIKFHKSGSVGGHLEGKELIGALRNDNKGQLCIEMFFDTLLKTLDLEDSLTGKTFYFTSGTDYPNIRISHKINNNSYNDLVSQNDVGGDYFLHISKVEALPVGSWFWNARWVQFAVTGIFKARFRNSAGHYENTTGDFLMHMEYVEIK